MPVDLKQIFLNKFPHPIDIKEVRKLNLWWNSNCAIVVREACFATPHFLFLIVHEPPFRKVKENTLIKYIIDANSWNEEQIQKNFEEWGKKLNGERPFLSLFFLELEIEKYKEEQKKYSVSDKFFGERIIEINVEDINIPDEYIRPLDIVWRKISAITSHVGIYLGVNKVCHIYPNNNPQNNKQNNNNVSRNRLEDRFAGDNAIKLAFNLLSQSLVNTLSSGSSSSGGANENLWVRIDEWEDFLDGSKKVVCYHSIIPSKKPSLIINHIKKALQSKYGKYKYSPMSKNCEHFANLTIHGVNFSRQVRNFGLISFEEKKIIESIEERTDELIFDNLTKNGELTEKEQQIFECLEVQIEIIPK